MNAPVRTLSRMLFSAIAFMMILSGHASNGYATVRPAAFPAERPCSLLTQAEVETALGKGATMSAVRNPRTDMDECRLKPGQPGRVHEIIVVVLPAQGWDMVKKSFVDGKNVKEVRGLGEDAFVGRFMGYNVRKGHKYVKVFGPLDNDNAANEKATRYLAERAAARL
jgi:hypothetical protein